MIEGRGGEAVFVRTDVSSPAEVAKLVGRAVDAYRRLDLAFNDAGVEDAMAMTAECSEDNRDRTLNINLKGVYLCMKHELPRMLERKRGIGGLTRVAAVMWLCSGSASFVTGQALAVDGGWVAQ